MRLANLDGRLVIVADAGSGPVAADVHALSGARFAPDPQAVFTVWAEFRDWVDATGAASTPDDGFVALDPARLGPPVPRPRQVFGIGLNYRDHAEEAGVAPPPTPTVFTKFPTSLTGPTGDITLTGATVDWEVELVVAIGATARHVAAERAWAHVAGVTVGQDLSERTLQMSGPAPQFSLAKSFPGYSPIGPWLVTPDELSAPDDLALSCSVNGEQMQKSRTSSLIFTVPALIAELSAVLPLLPGDLIFTGTPAGVGMARSPARYLRPGDELVSTIDGVGTLRHHFVAA